VTYLQVKYQPDDRNSYTYRTNHRVSVDDLVLVDAAGIQKVAKVVELGRGNYLGTIKSIIRVLKSNEDPHLVCENAWSFYGEGDNILDDVCCMLYPEPHNQCYYGEGEYEGD
jgi:hypothetical protein